MPDEPDLPALLRQKIIRIPAGAWRGRDLLSPTGDELGYAERGALYVPNGGPIATLRRQRRGDDGYRVWVIEDADGREVGSLVPASRVNSRGNRKPIKASDPLSWTGSVRLTGSAREIAQIRAGTVFHPEGGRVAEVLLGDKRWFGTQSMWGAWTPKFYDCTDLRLRVACFGWLALAWTLQRTLDTSD